MRIVGSEDARPLHTDAAAAIGMIHEDKFAPVGMRFFQRGKSSCFRAKDFTVFRLWFFASGVRMNEQHTNKHE